MYKTNSINWKAVSTKDLIWIEAAFLVDGETNMKIKESEMKISADLRFLMKDLDDLKRLQLSQGKKNSVLSWYDLPSMQGEKKPEESVKLRKEFLKNLSDQFKNK